MDFNKPQPTSVYSLLLGEIRTGQADLARMDFSTSSNIPTGAIQWSAANSRWERYNGSSFEALVTTYNINVQNFGGQTASFYRNASNLNTGTIAAARLPAASTSAQGAVQLSASTTSNSQSTAATSSAVNAIRQLADGKADANHTHTAGDLPSASTSAAGIVQLNTSTSSTSTSQAATPSAVRQAYNLAGSKANASHTHSASELTSGTLPAARFNDGAHGNRSGGGLHATATSNTHGFMSAADKAKLDSMPLRRIAVNTTSIVVNNSITTVDITRLTFNVVNGRGYKLSAYAFFRQQNNLANLRYGFYLSTGAQLVSGDVRHVVTLQDNFSGGADTDIINGGELDASSAVKLFSTKGMLNDGRMIMNSNGAFVASGSGSITLVLGFTQGAATSANTTFFNGWVSVEEAA